MLVFLDENNTYMCAIFAQIIFINNICLSKRAVPSENVSLKHMQTIEIQLVCTSRSFGGLHCLLIKSLVTVEYSRLSLSRNPKGSMKHFEISVLRHIRFAELRKTINLTTTFNKMNL